jgi:hypothetical protein
MVKAATTGKQGRAERHSRSVLLHGYGGAMLRIFGTYQLNDGGKPEKIVVRAYHRVGKAEPWVPGATSTPTTVHDLEDEIADLEVRATAAGWKRAVRRGVSDRFDKDSLPAPGTPPDARMRKRDAFTAGGIPDPLPVKQGGGGGRGRR